MPKLFHFFVVNYKSGNNSEMTELILCDKLRADRRVLRYETQSNWDHQFNDGFPGQFE